MYKQGHFKPFWGDNHVFLDYQREEFNNTEDIHLWRSQGYSNLHFTGLMYDMKNKMPDWTNKFFELFEGKNIGLSFYKMETCNILPTHQDTYHKYKILHNIKDNLSIWRSIIFLEDWKLGHIFEIENDPITKWKAGDYVLWQYDTPHMAANIGLNPRYTAQLTFTYV